VSVLAYSPHPIDPVTALATRGIDLRERISARIDVTPSEQSALGSPLGVAWNGRSTLKHRIGTRSPIEGVYMVGAHTTPGAGVPYVGLSAALVAQVIGPAR
jgi:UDP-galactopyranose mutase